MRSETLARIVAGRDLGRPCWVAKFRLCPGGRWFTIEDTKGGPLRFSSRERARDAAEAVGTAYRLTRKLPR